MMRRTIAVKRADLFKLYLCCRCGNDERMYLSSLYTGIPDGLTVSEVFDDISLGEYDDDIDDLISHYDRWVSTYENSGFILDRKSDIINTRKDLLSAIKNMGIDIPLKIMKKHY